MSPGWPISRFSTACGQRPGGVIDDILVYRQPYGYVVVCNASNRDAVKARLRATATRRGGQLRRSHPRYRDDRRPGPAALETLQPLFDQPLEPVPYYHFTMGRLLGSVNAVISRTGYTGEDGFEVIVAAQGRGRCLERPARNRARPMASCRAAWVPATPCVSRPAMPLYGHELSESINPFAAGVGWAVKLDKGDFAGRDALKDWKDAPGLDSRRPELEGKRIARQGAVVFRGRPPGRRRDLGNVFADLANQPGDGAGRSRRGGDRHRACRRRPRPPRAGPGRQAAVLQTQPREASRAG